MNSETDNDWRVMLRRLGLDPRDSEDAVFCQRAEMFGWRVAKCEDCGGSGSANSKERCWWCDGSGEVDDCDCPNCFGHECEHCDGSGLRDPIEVKCRSCNGHGLVRAEAVVAGRTECPVTLALPGVGR